MSCDLEEYSKSYLEKKVKRGCHNLDCLSFATSLDSGDTDFEDIFVALPTRYGKSLVYAMACRQTLHLTVGRIWHARLQFSMYD